MFFLSVLILLLDQFYLASGGATPTLPPTRYAPGRAPVAPTLVPPAALVRCCDFAADPFVVETTTYPKTYWIFNKIQLVTNCTGVTPFGATNPFDPAFNSSIMISSVAFSYALYNQSATCGYVKASFDKSPTDCDYYEAPLSITFSLLPAPSSGDFYYGFSDSIATSIALYNLNGATPSNPLTIGFTLPTSCEWKSIVLVANRTMGLSLQREKRSLPVLVFETGDGCDGGACCRSSGCAEHDTLLAVPLNLSVSYPLSASPMNPVTGTLTVPVRCPVVALCDDFEGIYVEECVVGAVCIDTLPVAPNDNPICAVCENEDTPKITYSVVIKNEGLDSIQIFNPLEGTVTCAVIAGNGTMPDLLYDETVTIVCDLSNVNFFALDDITDIQISYIYDSNPTDVIYVPDFGDYYSGSIGTCSYVDAGDEFCQFVCSASACEGVYSPWVFGTQPPCIPLGDEFEEIGDILPCGGGDSKTSRCCSGCVITIEDPVDDNRTYTIPCTAFCQRGRFDKYQEAPLAFLNLLNASSGVVDIDRPITCQDAGWDFGSCTCLLRWDDDGEPRTACPDITLFNETTQTTIVIPSSSGYDVGVPYAWATCSYNTGALGYGIVDVNIHGLYYPETFPYAPQSAPITPPNDLEGVIAGITYAGNPYSAENACPEKGCCCGPFGVGQQDKELCEDSGGFFSPLLCTELLYESDAQCGKQDGCCDDGKKDDIHGADYVVTMGTWACTPTWGGVPLEFSGPCALIDEVCTTSVNCIGAEDFCIPGTLGKCPIFFSSLDVVLGYESTHTVMSVSNGGFDVKCNYSDATSSLEVSVVFSNTDKCDLGYCCDGISTTVVNLTSAECVGSGGKWTPHTKPLPVCKRDTCQLKIGTDPEDPFTYGKTACDGCCDNNDIHHRADHCVKMCRFTSILTADKYLELYNGGDFLFAEHEDYFVFDPNGAYSEFPEAILTQSDYLIDHEAYDEFMANNFPSQERSCMTYLIFYMHQKFRAPEFNYEGQPALPIAFWIEAAARSVQTGCSCYYDGACPSLDLDCEFFRIWSKDLQQNSVVHGTQLSSVNDLGALRCRYTFAAEDYHKRTIEAYELLPDYPQGGRPRDVCQDDKGRCCKPDGTCVDNKDKWECLDTLHGVYGGQGTLCNESVVDRRRIPGPPVTADPGICGLAGGACCVPGRISSRGCVEGVTESQCEALHPGAIHHGVGSRCEDQDCPVNYCDLDPQTGKCSEDCCADNDPDTLDHCVKMCSIYYTNDHGQRIVLASGPEIVFSSTQLMETPVDNCTQLYHLIRAAATNKFTIKMDQRCECFHLKGCVQLPSPNTFSSTDVGLQSVSADIEDFPECFCPPIVTNCGIFEAPLKRDYGIYGLVLTSATPDTVNTENVVGLGILASYESNAMDLYCLYLPSDQGNVINDLTNLLDTDTDAAGLIVDISSPSIVDHCGPSEDELPGACCLYDASAAIADQFSCVNTLGKAACTKLGGHFSAHQVCSGTESLEFDAECYDLAVYDVAFTCDNVPVAACEAATGECQVTYATDPIIGDTHQIAAFGSSTCRDVQCPEPLGACCVPTVDRCVEVTYEACCNITHGVWKGVLTKCAEIADCNEDCLTSKFLGYITLDDEGVYSEISIDGVIDNTDFETVGIPPSGVCQYETSQSGVWYTVEGTGRILAASICHERTEFDGVISVYTHDGITKHGNYTDACNHLQCLKSIEYECDDGAAADPVAYSLDFALLPNPDGLCMVDEESAHGQMIVKPNPETSGASDTHLLCVSLEPTQGCMQLQEPDGCLYADITINTVATTPVLHSFYPVKISEITPLHMEGCIEVSSVDAEDIVKAMNGILLHISEILMVDDDCADRAMSVDVDIFTTEQEFVFKEVSSGDISKIDIGRIHNETFTSFEIEEDVFIRWCSLYGVTYYIFIHNNGDGGEGKFHLDIVDGGNCLSNDRCKHGIPVPSIYPHPHPVEDSCRLGAVGYEHEFDFIDSGDDWATQSDDEPDRRKRGILLTQLSDSTSESDSHGSYSASESANSEDSSDEIREAEYSVNVDYEDDFSNLVNLRRKGKTQHKVEEHSEYIEYIELNVLKEIEIYKKTHYEENDSHPRRVCMSSQKSTHDPENLLSTRGSTGNEFFQTSLATATGDARCDYENGCGVWFTFNHPRQYVIEASTCYPFTNFPAHISVFSGEKCSSSDFKCEGADVVTCEGEEGESQGSIARWCAKPGVDYHILVHGILGEVGEFELCFEEIKPCECIGNDEECRINVIGEPLYAKRDTMCIDSNQTEDHIYWSRTCREHECVDGKCVEEISDECCYDTLPFICQNDPASIAGEWIDRNEEQYARLVRATTGYSDPFTCREYKPFCHAADYFSTPTQPIVVKRSPVAIGQQKRIAEQPPASHETVVIRIPSGEDFPPWGPPCCDYDTCFTDEESTSGLTHHDWLLKATQLMTESKYLIGKYRALDPKECIYSSYHKQSQQSACCANLILRSLTESCVLSNQTGVLDHSQCVNDPTLFYLGLCQSKIDYDAGTSEEEHAFTCQLTESGAPPQGQLRDYDYNEFVANLQRVRISVPWSYPKFLRDDTIPTEYIVSAYNIHVDPRAVSDQDLRYVFATHTHTTGTAPPHCINMTNAALLSVPTDIDRVNSFLNVRWNYIQGESSQLTFGHVNALVTSGSLVNSYATYNIKKEITILESTSGTFLQELSNVLEKQSDCCVQPDIRATLTLNVFTQKVYPNRTAVSITSATNVAGKFDSSKNFRVASYDPSCGIYLDTLAQPLPQLSYVVPTPCEIYRWNLQGIPLCTNSSLCVGGSNASLPCQQIQHCVNGICYQTTGSNGICAFKHSGVLIPEIDLLCNISNNQCPEGKCYGLDAHEKGSRPDACSHFQTGVLQHPHHGTTFSCTSSRKTFA